MMFVVFTRCIYLWVFTVENFKTLSWSSCRLLCLSTFTYLLPNGKCNVHMASAPQETLVGLETFPTNSRSCKIGEQTQSSILQSGTTGPWVGSSYWGRSSGTKGWWKRSCQIADQQVWMGQAGALFFKVDLLVEMTGENFAMGVVDWAVSTSNMITSSIMSLSLYMEPSRILKPSLQWVGLRFAVRLLKQKSGVMDQNAMAPTWLWIPLSVHNTSWRSKILWQVDSNGPAKKGHCARSGCDWLFLFMFLKWMSNPLSRFSGFVKIARFWTIPSLSASARLNLFCQHGEENMRGIRFNLGEVSWHAFVSFDLINCWTWRSNDTFVVLIDLCGEITSAVTPMRAER